MTVASQAPLFMEFSRQEFWSGLPFPLPGIEPESLTQGSNPHLLCLLHCRQIRQTGSLSRGRGGSLEHILNSLLGRDVLTYDMLFLSEKLYLEGHCVCCQELLLSDFFFFSSCPLPDLGSSPFVVSAVVPNPYMPESQTHLTQMVALLGR